MARIQWELFWRILTENPHSCDEIEARIDGEYTIFGYLKEAKAWQGWRWVTTHYDRPFWIGDCDIPNGVDFATAEELVNAPVFGGKSMREVWPQMEIDGAAGMPVEAWMAQQPIPGMIYEAAQELWRLPPCTQSM